MIKKGTTYPVKGSTRLAGVIGWPIHHSMSPIMHNAAFEKTGLDVIYVPFGIPKAGLENLLTTLKAIDAIGVNVTIPHKENIISLLDSIDDHAAKIGAVNTVVFKNGKTRGYNTDASGFMTCVKKRIKVKEKKAILLGGGGAGRAIAMALVLSGIKELLIVDTDNKRLKKIKADLKKHSKKSIILCSAPNTELLKASLEVCDLLVNATPLGLKPEDPLPINKSWMPKNRCIMDIVYGKGLTPFLKLARTQGNKIIPGWEMLLYQGVDAFELWTGISPSVSVMENALLNAAGIKKQN